MSYIPFPTIPMFDKIIIIWDMILILQYLMSNLYHGTESLSNLGPRIWNLVPDKLKQLVDIHAFKKEIKKWKPENCPCRLCKTYIPHVGFIWSLYMFLNTHSGAVHQKLRYKGVFLRENADIFPLVHLCVVLKRLFYTNIFFWYIFFSYMYT